MRVVRSLTVLGALLGASLGTVGCAHQTIGELTSTGFVHDTAQYSIGYADGSSRSILGAQWKLQNAKPVSGDELEYKVGEFPKWEFDTNEDGVADAWVQVPSADLRFVHLQHGGVIFVRSIPLDSYDESLALDVFGEHMAQAMSGAEWYAFGTSGNERVVERRSAVLTEQMQAVTVSGVEGTAMTYSFADVDQLQMTSSARTGKMELVMLRPGMAFSLDRWSGRKPKESPSQLMLLVGYWNLPARFDAGRADFDELLARIAFQGKPKGLQRGASIALNQPPAAPVVATPAPEAASPYDAPTEAPAPAADDDKDPLMPISPMVGPVGPSP